MCSSQRLCSATTSVKSLACFRPLPLIMILMIDRYMPMLLCTYAPTYIFQHKIFVLRFSINFKMLLQKVMALLSLAFCFFFFWNLSQKLLWWQSLNSCPFPIYAPLPSMLKFMLFSVYVLFQIVQHKHSFILHKVWNNEREQFYSYKNVSFAIQCTKKEIT